MRTVVFLVLLGCALAAASTSGESNNAAATTSARSRARAGWFSHPSLPSLPSIPSPSSIFNDAKDSALKAVNSLLPSVDSLKTSIGNPVKNAINSAASGATGKMNQALADTRKWVSDSAGAINVELDTMQSALDTATSGLTNEVRSLAKLAETARSGLNDLYSTLKKMMTSTFTLTVDPNCKLPTAIGQINTLAKDYAGINTLIPQDKWCTVVALMEKISGGSSIAVNRAPPINSAASSFLERVSQLRTHNIHSTSFMEAAAGMQVKVGDLAYSCPKMLSSSDALEGGFNAAHLIVSAIDSNVKDTWKIQPIMGTLGILIRAATTIMRSICGFYKKLDSSCY